MKKLPPFCSIGSVGGSNGNAAGGEYPRRRFSSPMLSVLPHRELTLRSPLFPYNLNQVVPCDSAVSIWRRVLLDAPSLSAGDLLRRSAEQASALHQISLQDIRRRSGWLNDSPLSFNWLCSIPISEDLVRPKVSPR